MPGLGEYLNNALGLLNRVGPLGTTVPTQMRGMSLGGLLNSMNDTAQGVSRGMSADLLGAPVDIVSQLMTVPRFLGAPTPDFTQSPVGGSQWIGQKMENIGLLRQPTNSANEVAGRVIGGMLATPSVVGAVGSTAERGLLAAGQNAMIPNRMSPQAGAIVWHGSPHKFDKFDSSKIGTGEGAQAYGHGLYLADEQNVARSYVPKSGAPSWNGKPVSSYGMDGSVSYADGSVGKISDKEWSAFRQAMENGPRTGSLYKVDLPDEQIAKMLDWDKPLSQQAPEVQKALKAAGVADVEDWLQTGLRGSEIYKRAKRGAPSKLPLRQVDDEVFAANKLKEAGIPGIRYLDGGSRGAGEGTRNYVVFPGNEDLLKILERK